MFRWVLWFPRNYKFVIFVSLLRYPCCMHACSFFLMPRARWVGGGEREKEREIPTAILVVLRLCGLLKFKTIFTEHYHLERSLKHVCAFNVFFFCGILVQINYRAFKCNFFFPDIVVQSGITLGNALGSWLCFGIYLFSFLSFESINYS